MGGNIKEKWERNYLCKGNILKNGESDAIVYITTPTEEQKTPHFRVGQIQRTDRASY